MTALNTDKLRKVVSNTGWQVGAAGVADAAVTTIPLVSVTGLPTDTAVLLTIDRVDSSGNKTPTKMERVIGIVSSNNIIDCVRGVEGTAQAHSGGAVVEIVISAATINDLMTAILLEHNQDGSHLSKMTNSLFAQALINGNFDVWQRGTSIACTAADAYAADRWYIDSATAADDKTVSQQDGTGVPGSVLCARVQRPNGQTTVTDIRLSQALESQDSKKFRGQKLTLSFWARKGANFSAVSDVLTAKIVTGKGTDQKLNAFTTPADVVSETKTLTAVWQKFTITTTNVIASDITQIGVSLSFTPVGTASVNDYFEVTQVQLCSGAVELPFMAKSFEEELAKCQRYYFEINAEGATYTRMANGQCYSASAAQIFIFFPVAMRRVPDFAYNQLGVTNAGTSLIAASAVTLTIGKTKSALLSVSVASGLVAGDATMLMDNNSGAAYVQFSAEF